MSKQKCRKCANWEECPIRQGEYCMPVRKPRKSKKRLFKDYE